MNKFAVIIPYFGKLKPSFALWYESARRNSDVDFFIFTNDSEPQNPANNVKWIDFTLQKFNELAIEKLGVGNFTIKKPYKLCDFKPMYGCIFEDYLKGYEYWAYGDVDVIYGKISESLQKIDYHKYDKINHAGHLCFFKNEPQLNNLFKVSVKGSRDYEDVLESINVAFDETDMNFKVRALHLFLYDGVFAADIVNEKGMQLVDDKFCKNTFKNKMTGPKNYHYQIFVLQKGRIIRYYKKFFTIKKDEFCYIHYRLELPIYLNNTSDDTFIISFRQNGFYNIDLSNINKMKCFMQTVKKYNPRKPLLMEKFFAVINLIKIKIFKVKK